MSEVAQKLIVDDYVNKEDCISMWKALEKRKTGSDDLWVWDFLKAVSYASKLPTYHYMKATDRKELSNRIKILTRDLSRVLKTNDLDAHIIFHNGKIFNGFFLLEDLGESNREIASNMV